MSISFFLARMATWEVMETFPSQVVEGSRDQATSFWALILYKKGIFKEIFLYFLFFPCPPIVYVRFSVPALLLFPATDITVIFKAYSSYLPRTTANADACQKHN